MKLEDFIEKMNTVLIYVNMVIGFTIGIWLAFYAPESYEEKIYATKRDLLGTMALMGVGVLFLAILVRDDKK